MAIVMMVTVVVNAKADYLKMANDEDDAETKEKEEDKDGSLQDNADGDCDSGGRCRNLTDADR